MIPAKFIGVDMKTAQNGRGGLDNIENSYMPVCATGPNQLIGNTPISFIPQAVAIKDRYNSLNPLLKGILNRLAYDCTNSRFNTELDLKIIQQKIEDEDYYLRTLLSPNYIFRDGINLLSSSPNLKVFIGRAIAEVSTGQLYTLQNTQGTHIYYSNYFFLAEVQRNGTGHGYIRPLAMLVIHSEDVYEYNSARMFEQEFDNSKLEFWIDADFTKSTNSVKVVYDKIMYPILRDNNIKIVPKYDLLLEFKKGIRKPKFDTIRALNTYKEEVTNEFILQMRSKLGLTESKKVQTLEQYTPEQEQLIQGYMTTLRNHPDNLDSISPSDVYIVEAVKRIRLEIATGIRPVTISTITNQPNIYPPTPIRDVDFDEHEDDEELLEEFFVQETLPNNTSAVLTEQELNDLHELSGISAEADLDRLENELLERARQAERGEVSDSDFEEVADELHGPEEITRRFSPMDEDHIRRIVDNLRTYPNRVYNESNSRVIEARRRLAQTYIPSDEVNPRYIMGIDPANSNNSIQPISTSFSVHDSNGRVSVESNYPLTYEEAGPFPISDVERSILQGQLSQQGRGLMESMNQVRPHSDLTMENLTNFISRLSNSRIPEDSRQNLPIRRRRGRSHNG